MGHHEKEARKLQEPITPTPQNMSTFPNHNFGNKNRRYSRETSTTCSPSSSLYETTSDQFHAGFAHEQFDANSTPMIGAGYSSTDSDTEDDTDLDLDLANTRLSNRKSQELFRDLDHIMSSPTLNKQLKPSCDYFSPKEHTPIFKRLISKNSLKPQLKSFKRITAELQYESVPLENEINHEKLMLLNLQNENESRFNKNDSHFKKFDLIKKANENWSLKKHAQQDTPIDAPATKEKTRKRSFDESNIKSKRRAVSTSPITPGFTKRGNIKLISNTSNDLEHLSLK